MTIQKPTIGGSGPLPTKSIPAGPAFAEDLAGSDVPAVGPSAKATDAGAPPGQETLDADLNLGWDKTVPRAVGRVDFKAPVQEMVQSLLPGARFEGRWTLVELQQVKAVAEAMPEMLRTRLSGVTFVLTDPKTALPAGQAAWADQASRTLLMTPGAFELPPVQGAPAAQGLMATQLGRLLKTDTKALTEFAQLSGWEQTTMSASGERLEGPAPATGVPALHGEKTPTAGTGPLQRGGDRPAERPVGRLGRAPTAPLRPIERPGAPARPADRSSGPLPTPAPRGTSRLGPPQPQSAPWARTGPLTAAAVSNLAAPEPATGGSRLAMPDGTSVHFRHAAEARFAPGSQGARDPYTDYGESLRAYMFSPETLLAAAPEKFLFLNAESRRFSGVQVAAMAKAAGVSLPDVVTTLVTTGRVSQSTVEKICQFHGLKGDAVQLKANDQRLLDRSAPMAALLDRLSLDLSVQGAGTSAAAQQATGLAARYHQHAAKLELVPNAPSVLNGETKGAFRWMLQKVGAAQANRQQTQMTELRSEFQRLPLAVQLKTDPRMALGATWFALTPKERESLETPESLQRLIGQAAEKSDQLAYVPQNLTATEKRALATKTVLLALFDPAREGALLRSKLGGQPVEPTSRLPVPQDPVGALKALKAKNGEKVWDLLLDGDRQRLSDPRQTGEWKSLITDPVLQDALVTVREGTTGAEQIRAAVLKTLLAAPPDQDLRETARACLAAVQQAQDRLFTALDATPLDLALTAINRQVQEGNLAFVQKLLEPPQGRLDHVIGPLVWARLSPSEKKLLNDEGYRRHLVTEGAELRATGASLAEEARAYQQQTETLQQAFDHLFRPENQFRSEFARDPVGALQRRGLWKELPDPAQQALMQAKNTPQLPQLVAAVQQAIAPMLTQQAVAREYRENLRKSVRQVNAGNYRGLFRVLELPRAELQRTVTQAVGRAMEQGEFIPRSGNPGLFA